ncbi:GntR family transcriptional regulator [Devosia elaeis]|uniref:GntR family transcriptional regulator n=1 Tax=Devosia elaeis TaxID=1770058 RepID=A0A178HRH0_9HYPH|nr:GntR family transcriptional regulator [Devosia elaeis]
MNVAYKTWRDVLTVAASISNKIVEAILSQQLAPEARLGESELATLFNCSRTIVREAMLDLAARGIVTVIPRRGWFLTQVDAEMARELYDARQIIETGLLRHFAQKGRPLEPHLVQRLQSHLAEQQLALEAGHVGRRSYLLGNFHVCLAECLGNRLLAEKLRDFTVLTTLFTMRHQTPGDARMSYEEHVAIVEALASGRLADAGECMREHLGTWDSKVHMVREVDPLDGLRRALAPMPSDVKGVAAGGKK